MKHDFIDIDLAFEFVRPEGPFMNSVVICKKTGHIYYSSGLGDSDDDFPDESDEDDYFFIPHKNDLDLGTRLVHRFANDFAPHLSDEIRNIFSRKGAYSRYKDLLSQNGLLDAWHKFEDTVSNEAIREWCRDNGIELKDSLPKHAE